MRSRVLLVATWGSPWRNPCREDPNSEENFSWHRVVYVYSDEEKGAVRRTESRTSLKLLYDVYRPDEVHIIVCDTVACARDGDRYSVLVKRIEERYRQFIEKELGGDLAKKCWVHVVPCFGAFSNGVFLSSPLDTYATVLYELYRAVKRAAENAGSVKLVVDLTHGINYMPAILYRAAERIARIASFGTSVELIVVNSDPYAPSRDTGVRELRINTVEHANILKSLDLHYAAKLRGSTNPVYRPSSAEYSKEVGRANREFRECSLGNLLNLYSAVYLGAPLAVHTYMLSEPEFENVRRCVDRYFEKFRSDENVVVERSDGGLRVWRKLSVDEQMIFALESLVLAESLRAAGVKSSREVELKTLEETAEKIAWSRSLHYVMKNEVSSIKMLICRYLVKKLTGVDDRKIVEKCVEVLKELSEWRTLRDIAKELGMSPGEFQYRNFIAHSGLEYNVTKVKLGLVLSYEEKMLKDIENCLKSLYGKPPKSSQG